MTAGIPEIKVRLTPEGVAEVAAALRKVQAEARAASETAGTIDLVTGAVGRMKGVLATLGFAASVAGIIALGKNAIDAGEGVFKLGRLTGASTENISALNLAATQSGVSQDLLRNALVQTSKSLGELNRGLGDQVDAFAELGLSTKDFAGKDTVEAFALINQRLAGMADGWQKTELERRIFGRGLGELKPLLAQLGSEGLPALRAEAERLGLIIGGETAEQSEKFNSQLHALEASSGSLVRQIVGDLLPSLNEIAKSMLDAKKEGAGFFGTLYQGAQKAFQEIFRLNNAGDINEINRKIVNLTDDYLGLEKLQLGGQNVKARLDEIKAEVDALVKKREVLEGVAKLEQPGAAPGKPSATAGAGVPGGSLDSFKATQDKLNELIKRAGLEQITIVQQIAKDRREITEKGAQAERTALEARLASTANLLSTQQQLEQTELASIRRRTEAASESYRTEIALANARENALRAAALRQFPDDRARTQLLDLIDRQSNEQRLAAAKVHYDSLIALNNDYLAKYKGAQQQIVALDREIADSRKSAADAVTNIKLQGLSTEEQASLRLRQAWEKDAELRSAVLAGDVEKARKLRDEIVGLAQQVIPASGKFGSIELVESAQSKFELLAAQQKQAAQATAKTAAEGAQSVEQQIAAIAAQITKLQESLLLEVKVNPDQQSLRGLVDKIREALKNEEFSILVRPSLLGLPLQGQADGGPVAALAAGGPVPGSSPHPRADNVLIRATAGEFMQPVRAVRHYGPNFMESVRNLTLPRYAEGGLIGAAPSGSAAAGGSVQHVDISFNRGRPGRFSGSGDDIRMLVDGLLQLKRGVTGGD